MKNFKVELTHTVTMFVKGESEEQVQDFINCHTPDEVIDLAKSQGNDVYEEDYSETIFCEVDPESTADYVIDAKRIDDIIEGIMSSCAQAAWIGAKSRTMNFISTEGTKLIFEGTVYEPCYEDFAADCNVYYQERGKDRVALRTITDRSAGAYKKETVEKGSVADVIAFAKDKLWIVEEEA